MGCAPGERRTFGGEPSGIVGILPHVTPGQGLIPDAGSEIAADTVVEADPVAGEVVPVEGPAHILDRGSDREDFQPPTPGKGLRTRRQVVVHPPLVIAVRGECGLDAGFLEIIDGIRPVLVQQQACPGAALQPADLGCACPFHQRAAQHDGVERSFLPRGKRGGNSIRPFNPEGRPVLRTQPLQVPPDLRIPGNILDDQHAVFPDRDGGQEEKEAQDTSRKQK